MNFITSFPVEEAGNLLLPGGEFALVSFRAKNESREIEVFSGEKKTGSSFLSHPFSAEEIKKDHEASREEHATMITAALNAIARGELQKVVVSRQKKETIHKTFSEWLDVFTQLCSQYPSACIYWFGSGEESWMGATPELLLEKKGDQFTTKAIAGTQPFSESTPIESYQWGEKEFLEQIIVTDYICTTLRAAGVTEISLSPPQNLRAGNVVHICTSISFRFDGEVSHLLHHLHPTPAVCGFPLEESKKFIRDVEAHGREMYSGYFGTNDENGDARFFVALRCMRIRKNEVTFFAGGGIVAGSVAEKEWDETERKMNTLRAVIG